MASSSGNDDDLTIPRAAINKMIKETLPNVRVANDARELVVNCCTEFIHLISSEANEICNKSEKKTISPEHVIQDNSPESLAKKGLLHTGYLRAFQLKMPRVEPGTFSMQTLESLGFSSYISEVKEVLQECKTVALKRRKASSRLENLGIPEEELLRQQQELFAKARQQQAELAQQEWLQMQQAAQQAQLAAASASASNQAGSSQDEDDEDDI
ncbi:protein Dr1 isoform X1 [Paroedura picta]|uniref:protein Dr1 isoform X1 n=1 Tax=Paroedura picta TaxID=143630 RepID=UPI0040570DF4